ncbi:MAG: hypothetical protein ACKPKO_15000 [Candidatus Fonsibacter sp.]
MLVNESYIKLTKYGVDVFSVKTDAFVLIASDLEKAYGLIQMDLDLGGYQRKVLLFYQVIHYNKKKTTKLKLNR